MKRILAFLLALVLLPGIWGCHASTADPVSFYYVRDPENSQYFGSSGVVHPEPRDVSNHHGDLQYLMSLYLAGPLEEGLRSPLPATARLLSLERTSEGITVTLNDLTQHMTELEFSLACACMTLTCCGMSGSDAVTVISGEWSLTMMPEQITLYDQMITTETTEGA